MLEPRDFRRIEFPARWQGRGDEVDHPLGAVEPSPEVVVLAVGAAEERAEIVELHPAQAGLRAAFADGIAVLR